MRRQLNPVTPVREQARLGDFTVTPRVLVITGLALLCGGASAVAAFVLLRLIGLITNIVFYQRFATGLIAPGLRHHPFWLVLGAPAAGGLAVGLMARYGSEKIRGHGMPEAIEAILAGGSRIAPRVALLKPVSAAISIGSGGPFGAEGPIIMTGGAVGSILAQALKLTADERKTLLVAGAAGGMAATFNSPFAAVLLAVELLLFEWRPRSFVPVVAASCVATVCRGFLLGSTPLFPVAAAAGAKMPAGVDALCLLSGLTGGMLAVGATWLVYRAEDLFTRLPLHWMWWPAIGGLIVGAGGLIEPRALGVGYDVIDQLLTGRAGFDLIVGILVVKTAIWSMSLGSGTSGGVLAPVFMIGGSLGALEAHVLPAVFPGFWAMMGLAAVVGGVMRSPLTGVVFTLELTHAWSALLPLVIAATSAYALSAVVLRRSVLTEKLARRGRHLSREYSIDPLEAFFARDVMNADPLVLPAAASVAAAQALVTSGGAAQRLYPVAGQGGELLGAVTRSTLRERAAGTEAGSTLVSDIMNTKLVAVKADDTLRHLANLFAECGITSAPVVDNSARPRLLGFITLRDLLQARLHDHAEEHHRERHLIPRRRDPRRLQPAE